MTLVEKIAQAIRTLRHSTPEQQAIAVLKAMRFFPDCKDDPATPARRAFGTWRRDLRRTHGKYRMMVLSDENGRPLSAQALDRQTGKPFAEWTSPAPIVEERIPEGLEK